MSTRDSFENTKNPTYFKEVFCGEIYHAPALTRSRGVIWAYKKKMNI